MAQRAVGDDHESPTLVQVSIPRDMMRDIDALAAKARVGRATMCRTMLAQLLDSMKRATELLDSMEGEGTRSTP